VAGKNRYLGTKFLDLRLGSSGWQGSAVSADQYRLYALECFRIAEGTADSRHRISLLNMAQSWLLLAQQAEKNRTTDLVNETPLPASRPAVVQQQQQQAQPKKEE
jgi:hypothetical protein